MMTACCIGAGLSTTHGVMRWGGWSDYGSTYGESGQGGSVIRDVLALLRGLPDWIAWCLDAFTVRMKDRDLSPYVYDAWWWQ